MANHERRRRAVALGAPALIVALLAILAFWRMDGPLEGEHGAMPTMGINPDRRAALDEVAVRQVVGPRAFWVGEPDEEPTFVVVDRPVAFEAGAVVSIVGRVEPAPPVEIARREWGVDEATARAVRARGAYVRAVEVRAAERR